MRERTTRKKSVGFICAGIIYESKKSRNFFMIGIANILSTKKKRGIDSRGLLGFNAGRVI